MLNKPEKEMRATLYLAAVAIITLGRAISGASFNAKKITSDARDLTDGVVQEINQIESGT
jgi:hypothetical protein